MDGESDGGTVDGDGECGCAVRVHDGGGAGRLFGTLYFIVAIIFVGPRCISLGAP